MAKEPIQLSDHFTYGKLLRFTFPSIIMMIFTSIYGVVDGLFVSNYAGSTAFASINLVMPFLMVFSAIGFMVGAGGTALVAKTFGEGKPEEARSIFSLLIYTLIVAGIVVTIVGEIVLEPVAAALGADETMLPYCLSYGRILLFASVPFMLQSTFQTFMITAEKPKLGLAITVGAGVTNMVGDFILVGLLNLNVVGAAWATVLSQAVGGLIPLIYFIAPNRSILRLGKPALGRAAANALFKTCTNGISEFMSNVSMSIVNMVYNYRLMKLVGENGVTAYGIIMYVNFIFLATFFGYSTGSAPIVSFHYGADNRDELKNIFSKSTHIIMITMVVMTAAAELLAYPLASIFVGYDAELLALSTRAMRLYSISFMLAGFNIYGSSFFTALNNGVISAIISFGRVLVFQLAAVIALPFIFGVDGVWLAMPAAELCSAIVTFAFFRTQKKRYGYL